MAYLPLGERMRTKQRRRIVDCIQEDMRARDEVANEVLLANLRKIMPRIDLPVVPSRMAVAIDPLVRWFPIYDRWAMALDDAMRSRGLAPLCQDSDPDDAVRRLLEHVKTT